MTYIIWLISNQNHWCHFVNLSIKVPFAYLSLTCIACVNCTGPLSLYRWYTRHAYCRCPRVCTMYTRTMYTMYMRACMCVLCRCVIDKQPVLVNKRDTTINRNSTYRHRFIVYQLVKYKSMLISCIQLTLWTYHDTSLKVCK